MRADHHDLTIGLKCRAPWCVVVPAATLPDEIKGRAVESRIDAAGRGEANHLGVEIMVARSAHDHCFGDDVPAVGLENVRALDDDVPAGNSRLETAGRSELCNRGPIQRQDLSVREQSYVVTPPIATTDTVPSLPKVASRLPLGL